MLQEPVLWRFTQTARLALKVFVKLEWFSKHCLNLETSFTRPLLRKEWPGFWKFKIPSRPMPGSSIQPSWVVKRLSVLTFFVHEQNQFLRLKTTLQNHSTMRKLITSAHYCCAVKSLRFFSGELYIIIHFNDCFTDSFPFLAIIVFLLSFRCFLSYEWHITLCGNIAIHCVVFSQYRKSPAIVDFLLKKPDSKIQKLI